MKKCCFTGYRPQKLIYLSDEKSEEYQKLSAALKTEIINAAERGYTFFLSGFAEGVDLLAAEIVIALRNDGWDVTLEAALPGMNQPQGWSDEARERYFELLDQADVKTCVDQTLNKYSFLRRDDYMVDQADLVIAVFDGQRGGTAYTVTQARRKNRNLWIVDPEDFSVRREEGLF